MEFFGNIPPSRKVLSKTVEFVKKLYLGRYPKPTPEREEERENKRANE